MRTQFYDGIVASQVSTDTIAPNMGSIKIDNPLILSRPINVDVDFITIDRKVNMYLNEPSQSYIAELTEGELVKQGVIDKMTQKGKYHIRNIFRGYHNENHITDSTNSYDFIVKDMWDNITFSSRLRLINVGPDDIDVQIDSRWEIESEDIETGDAFTNWCMTPIAGVDNEKVYTLHQGSSLILELFFMPEVIYVEHIKQIDTDIHENERCLGNRYNAFMDIK